MFGADGAKNGIVKGGGVEASAGLMAQQFDDLDSGELPMVKLGDASIAAPFTSKMPSIKSCVDIVRQGRCTLVSSIQMVCLCLSVVVDYFIVPFWVAGRDQNLLTVQYCFSFLLYSVSNYGPSMPN